MTKKKAPNSRKSTTRKPPPKKKVSRNEGKIQKKIDHDPQDIKNGVPRIVETADFQALTSLKIEILRTPITFF